MSDIAKLVSMSMALGDVLNTDQKSTNDFKLRMLKAGFIHGLDVPDDWDDLSEDEKTKRLEQVQGVLNE